jgi:protein TonB
MPVNASFDEPVIPPRLQRPLVAVWISLGLHAALIALVQVAPPSAVSLGEPVIEARLESPHTALPAAEVPQRTPAAETPGDSAPDAPPLAPGETAQALPVAEPAAPPPVPPAPTAAEVPPAAPATPQPDPASPATSAPLPGVTITSPVDLTYYGARDVDVPPRALREIVPDYPDAADRQRLSGKVRLQLKLEADGRVSDVDVVSAVPPGTFEASALKAFSDARFAPAQKDGRPVRARVLIEVEYDWEGRPR